MAVTNIVAATPNNIWISIGVDILVQPVWRDVGEGYAHKIAIVYGDCCNYARSTGKV
jgi:uncharacterized protein with PIN domain